MAQRSKWSLILIPDQQGVLNVGGRVGTALGPASFMKAFSRINGKTPTLELIEAASPRWVKGLTSSVEGNHEAAARLIASCYPHRVIAVGGGHDHGFSHLMGIQLWLQAGEKGPKKKNLKIGCINLDAHLDVRKPSPKITSGSPFYLAIESGVLKGENLIEFGIQNHCNAPELWDYAESKKIQIVPFSELRVSEAKKANPAILAFRTALKKLEKKVDSIVISLDLDCMAEAHCPGVSAPQAEGFDTREVFEMLEIAARSKKVVSLGIFELNPLHDLDGATARVAAVAAHRFMNASF